MKTNALRITCILCACMSALWLSACSHSVEPVDESKGATNTNPKEIGQIQSVYFHAGGFTGPSSMNGISKPGGHSQNSNFVNINCWVSPAVCFSISGSFLTVNEVENPTGWSDGYTITKNGP